MKLSLLNVCLPDYFSGYHKPVLQVPVHNTMTRDELAEALLTEIDMVFDYLSYENAWPEIDYKPLVEIFLPGPPEEIMFPDLPDDDDDEFVDSVYIFVIFESEDDDD